MQNIAGATDHLRSHQTFPATKADLVAACNQLSDFSEEDKQEFASKLEDKTYNSAEEVMADVGLSQPGEAGGGMAPQA